MNLRALLAIALVSAAAPLAAVDAPLREARGPGLVPPTELDRYWVLDARSQKALPNRKPGKAAGCATAKFMIDSEGNTLGVESVSAQPEGMYDEPLRKFLARAHYDMADGAEGDSVHTYMTLVWDAGDASQRPALEQACAMASP
jgi:hypothetical protein